jgi:hypothetical protein
VIAIVVVALDLRRGDRDDFSGRAKDRTDEEIFIVSGIVVVSLACSPFSRI